MFWARALEPTPCKGGEEAEGGQGDVNTDEGQQQPWPTPGAVPELQQPLELLHSRQVGTELPKGTDRGVCPLPPSQLLGPAGACSRGCSGLVLADVRSQGRKTSS